MATTEAAASLREKPHVEDPSTLSDLHDHLDSLWTSYLRHLDAYTTAQKALQQHLRSGFFSLSRANFNARPGMRYGSDYFHDRATATTRIRIDVDDDDGAFQHRTVKWSPVEDAEEGVVKEERVTQQPSPPATPDQDHDKAGPQTSTPASNHGPGAIQDEKDSPQPSTKSKAPLESDPIRWFGILVPQELRSAQVSFSSAVTENVAQGVNASRAMRETEIEIRKLRKEIRRAERVGKVERG